MLARCALILLAVILLPAQEGWWMRQPIRWVQTNLRETDSGLDARQHVDELRRFRANVLLLNMGGIVAQYPTTIEHHHRSPHMPPGRDPFGEVLQEAHSHDIKVVGRFDFSKTPKAVYDAHPEWFFRKANGEPVVFNELYSVCINGDYYHQKAMEVLTEALEKYPVDGLFFNMFDNQSRDYAGNFVGHCHCDSCQRKYRARFGRSVPAEPDDNYRQFLLDSRLELAAKIGFLIREKRPEAGYFNYIQEHTDGIMSESNTAVNRPLPLWPYTSSDNVNRARNSQPGKMSVNLCMQFVDYAWRWATVPAYEIALRLWQNVAHGGALAFAINGTFDQQDRQAMDAALPVFQWLSQHERYYVGQQSSARVLLLGNSSTNVGSYSQSSYRGLFRLLTEQHIPFSVANNLDWLGKRDFDLVIATDWVPVELEAWVNRGGKLLVASPKEPAWRIADVLRRLDDVEGFWRVRDASRFPSLARTQVLMQDGPILELDSPDAALPPLTLVPPSMIGPPEKIHIDARDTTIPGLVRKPMGQGEVVWLPWDIGGLYYRHSLPAHAGLLADVTDTMLPAGRQLRTNAHPLVEISLMRQGNRTLLHLVNVSGHSSTAYHAPLPVADIQVELPGTFRTARALRAATPVRLTTSGTGVRFTLPRLGDYELVVLE
ncbi:MAG: beta-galactosidase [Bryobacterales bacterium]|nr:beta-galactosidase [Bryobacterales bacterium]